MTSHLDIPTMLRLRGRGLSYEDEMQALDHLAHCAECRQRFVETEPVQGEAAELEASSETDVTQLETDVSPQGAAKIPRSAYSGVVAQVYESVIRETLELEQQRGTARELVEELQRLSPAQSELVIRNSDRHQAWAVAEELLEESRRGWSDDPERSERLAEFALAVASRLAMSGFKAELLNDLRAEAWSFIGNCRRIRSDLYAAETAFRSAWECLASGSGDCLTRATVLDLESSLQRAKRSFEAAERLLLEAIACYRELSDRHMEGRALLNVANLYWMRGRLNESLAAMEEAAKLLDVGREPTLLYALKKNTMLVLADLGRLDEARALLPEVRELGRSQDSRLERLRLRWTEGLLLSRAGQAELAEEVLRQVREGFISAGIGYDVALVSLDLAALCQEHRRNQEVRRLARETYPLFSSRGVHREALAAWNLFQQAAERDAVTIRLLEEVASRIREVKGPASPTDDHS